MDAVGICCVLLSLCAFVVFCWTLRRLWQARRALPPAGVLVAPVGAPAESLDNQVKRLAGIVQTLELTHLEALRILGGRLDALEDLCQHKKVAHSQGGTLTAVSSSIETTNPPPFV